MSKILLINSIIKLIELKSTPTIRLRLTYIIAKIIPFINPLLFCLVPKIIAAIKNNSMDKILVVMLLVFMLIKLFCFKIVKIREKIKVENMMNIKEKIYAFKVFFIVMFLLFQMYERMNLNMINYLLVAGKTLLFLFVIIVILKIMGKREIGQLNAFDIVIFFMISELFSLSIEKPKENVMMVLLPILIIFLMQLITSFIVLKSNKLRKIIEENPSFIINNGVLDIERMKKLRYNIDNLMEQIRNNQIDSPSKVQFAILESNGELSVIEKGKEDTIIPFPVIKDGEIDNRILEILNKDKNWVLDKIKERGYESEKQIFLCMIEKGENLFIIEKPNK